MKRLAACLSVVAPLVAAGSPAIAAGPKAIGTITVVGDAARIFDELYTTKDPGRGTGLGLWIAHNLVEESFGGTLTVESTVGFGSRFTIAVPPQALEPAVPHAGAA